MEEIYAALGKGGSGLTYEELGAAMVELGFLKYAHAMWRNTVKVDLLARRK